MYVWLLQMFVVTGMITKAIHKSSEEEKKEEEVKKTLEQHDNIVTQYKELIREQVHTAQVVGPRSAPPVALSLCVLMSSLLSNVSPQDAQIQELKEQVSSMSSQNEQMQTTITQQLSQIQQHKDQYNILKLKLGGFRLLLGR